MRTIKFRCWDIEKKDMRIRENDSLIDRVSNHIGEFFLFENPNYVYMQFTGLLDQDKKEIYESDIISFAGLETKFEVVWYEDEIMFDSKPRHIKLTKEGMAKFGKVIGNVYENKELLSP